MFPNMNIIGLLHRGRLESAHSLVIKLTPRNCLQTCSPRRSLATYRDAGPSVSQTLDTKKSGTPNVETVGPFRLGVSPSSLRNDEKIPKWSELNTRGKVIRTTARTTNLGVILLGAGLSALLIYSLTSELFSKNSPTVLYGEACERIKSSQRVAKYLHAPLTFHNNPPSAIRPRHRNRHVTSGIFLDSQGNEHMIMTFYVQGQVTGSGSLSDQSYLEAFSSWTKDNFNALSEASFDEVMDSAREWGHDVWESGRRAFKYLSGSPLSPPSKPSLEIQEMENREAKQKAKENSTWSLAGMFGSLKGAKGSVAELGQKGDDRIFTEGEVHADLVRNSDGYFVFRYLLIDLPSTRDHNPVRVFVERAPGVRDTEPVMRWNS